nr:PTS sugar transporter subunit IIA [[Clostridium] innocuum]
MIHNYFTEDLFCIPASLHSKDEAITYLCNLLEKNGYVDAAFKKHIYEREAIAPTCFGARYAIPHTTKKIAKKNGIAVALLKEPIIWDGFEVDVVLMFALHKSFDQVPKLYDLILSVFDDEARFQDLLECDSYQSFIKKIHIT